MYDALDFTLAHAACRWSLYFTRQASGRMFAHPGFAFELIEGDVLLRPVERYFSRYEATKLSPESRLQQVSQKANRRSKAVVLAIALDKNGDLFSDPAQTPAQLIILMRHIQSGFTQRRRIQLMGQGESALLLADHILPFDQRFMGSLVPHRTTEISATLPSASTLH